MKYLILTILVFVGLTSFGQQVELRPDQTAFENALDVYYDEELDSALDLFNRFLIDYPNSDLTPRAEYNMAYILRECQRDLDAIPVFKKIIDSNYYEYEPAGGLMEEYALYKHRSAFFLADIYLNQRDYDKAKTYIRLFDKKYKYNHFCGNEMMANEINTSRQYARLYHGQGKTNKAIKKLLPYLFYDGLASNDQAIELLDELLNYKYSKGEIERSIKQAISSLVINSDDKALIEFLDTKIQVKDEQLFALGNLDFMENLELEGIEKWNKVLNTHPLFSKYLK